MKPCPDCKARLADNCYVCPHCGKATTNPAHIVFGVLVLLMLLGFFHC